MVNKNILTSAIICLVIGVFSVPFAAASDNVTFEDAVNRLYGANENIEAANMVIESMEYEKKAAIGLFFPKISLNAAYAAFDKDLNMEVDLKGPLGGLAGGLGSIPGLGPAIGGIINNLPPLEQTIQQKSFFTLDATAVWPIFTGGKILAANAAANLKMQKAKIEGSSVMEELGATLAERYFSLRLARDVVVLRQDVFNTMKSHYEKALKMEKAGVLAKVERMHAAVAMQDAERAYNAALRDAGLAMAALKSMLNIDEDLNPSTPLFIVPAEVFDNLTYFQELAVSGNAKLRGAEVMQKLSQVSVQNEMSTFYPKVFLFGNAKIYNWQVTSLMPDFTFGVGVNFTIFEGLNGYHKVRAAQALEKSVYLKRTRAVKDIKTLVEQQYITMLNARADYEAVQTSIEFTKEYVRARTKAFDTGLATSLDVVDAELAFSKARFESIMAAYKFDTALAKLLDTAGIFGEFETYRAKASIETLLELK